jgi:hypothetical protein
LDDATDINAEGKTYGYGPGVSGTNGLETDSETIQTSDFSVTESSSNPSSQDVAVGEEDVTFLVAELDTAEEGVLVEELTVNVALSDEGTATSTDNYLENLTLELDGERVAGPLDIELNHGTASSVDVTVDNEFEVQGLQDLTVKADVTDEANNGNYTMSIDTANMSVEDMDGNIIDGDQINGSADGNNVNVGPGEPELSKDGTFGGQGVVAGSEDIKVGQFILQAADNEDLDISAYNVKIIGSGLNDSDIDNLYVNEESAESVTPGSETSFSVNETLSKGDTKRVKVYLDLDENATDDATITAELSIDAEGAVSGEDVTSTGFDGDFVTGQEMTVAEGDLSLDIGADTPEKQILVAGSEDADVAEFEFSAENDGFDVTEMNFAIVDESNDLQTGLVTDLKVNDNDYKAVTNGTVDITDEVRVDAGEDVQVEVRVKLNDDFNAISSGDELYVAMTGYEYESDSVGTVETVSDANATTTNTLAVYNTELTVSTTEGSDSNWGNTWKEIMDIEFTADEADRATVHQFDVNVDPQGATVTEIRLINSDGDTVATTTTSGNITNATTKTLQFIDADADGRIAAGSSETYTVEVNATDVSEDDSVVVELLESNFQWNDNEETTGAGDHSDLIDDLSGSYELIR